MFPLLETIRFENGCFSNTEYHIKRIKRSVINCLNTSLKFEAENVLKKIEAENHKRKGLFKFRFLYNSKTFRSEFVPYSLPFIKTLKPVIANDINYSCKLTNRKKLEELYKQKGTADDILIIKDGYVSDTSFANIIFFDGKSWYTPNTPVLEGTQREYLINYGVIYPVAIPFDDIRNFSKARIINAMIRFEDNLDVNIAKL